MATRLFFHAATSSLSNLPSTEQSTLTATHTVDATSVNRTMDPLKGTTQATLTFATTNSGANVDYFTKFVSPTINTTATGTTISANTWDYCFTAQGETGESFPTNGTNGPVYVCCYVWDTNTGTKVGNILDGNSNSNYDQVTGGASKYVRGTFTGAAVTGVTSTCVLVMEIWFNITTTTSADNDVFKYDGTNISADNTANTSSASFIGTPQDLVFNNETKLYFRSASNSLSGTLPSTEQSALAATVNGDAQTVNRTLNSAKGATQTSITTTSSAVTTAQNLYVSKFVSWQYLNVTSIPATNWSYSFAAAEPNLNANYPVSATNKAVYVNLYVWKTSNGTKTGTILDGNTSLAYDEPTVINTEISEFGTFAGSAVTGITPGDDVLVFEVWFQVTQGTATARADLWYYEGATETQETSVTVSDSASFLYTLAGLSFGTTNNNVVKSLTETVSISEGIARLAAKTRLAGSLNTYIRG